ncbi:MAG: hypothetical protein ACLGHY_11085 [Gammaproteobacteria bacterium]
MIHLALRELATSVLPQYEADDGPLTASQLRQIREQASHATRRSVRCADLVALKTASRILDQSLEARGIDVNDVVDDFEQVRRKTARLPGENVK